MTELDIGCGPNKVAGCYGVDIHPYEGVDQVFNFDQTPWPLKSSSYTRLYARHIIEHVADIPKFMNEIHRVGKAGAIVEIITPHFSSIDS
ncbi:MAG: methyltransferase domain-containing protein [Gammaproteobacteria bacterium]|nr:methyltransferase domain-containing protein [Gammaproteobacteria bacterium]